MKTPVCGLDRGGTIAIWRPAKGSDWVARSHAEQHFLTFRVQKRSPRDSMVRATDG